MTKYKGYDNIESYFEPNPDKSEPSIEKARKKEKMQKKGRIKRPSDQYVAGEIGINDLRIGFVGSFVRNAQKVKEYLNTISFIPDSGGPSTLAGQHYQMVADLKEKIAIEEGNPFFNFASLLTYGDTGHLAMIGSTFAYLNSTIIWNYQSEFISCYSFSIENPITISTHAIASHKFSFDNKFSQTTVDNMVSGMKDLREGEGAAYIFKKRKLNI